MAYSTRLTLGCGCVVLSYKDEHMPYSREIVEKECPRHKKESRDAFVSGEKSLKSDVDW